MNTHEETVRLEVQALSDTLRAYQKAYYVENRPLVKDVEYDRLFDRLQSLEEAYPSLRFPDSPTLRVGSDLTSEFPEVEHTIPVLSLDKAYSSEALSSWMARTEAKCGQDLSFVVEEKIDGVSIVLYYEKGLLVRAVTRGNGAVGNDVTANIRTIASIPLRLPEEVTVAVRGEVFLPKAEFLELNKGMEVPYANPRNLAAGTIRRIKSSEVAKVPLRIFVYEGFWQDQSLFADHLAILAELASYGFSLNPTIALVCKEKEEAEARLEKVSLQGSALSFADVDDYVRMHTAERASLAYEIDGLVIKVDELSVRESLGYTEHHPRWALAYKFESPQALTVVENIEVQVGRTGRITPVARVVPVLVGGSTVSNITLHNQTYIDMLELAIGDSVEISKRGDVIPAVERVIEKNEMGNGVWHLPDVCPSCSSALVARGGHTFCPNVSCPDQIRSRLEFFVGKAQMDIDALGPETIGVLIGLGLLKDVDDLYTIDYEKALCDQVGFGEKKIAAIKMGVEKSKAQPFRRVITSLGIAEIGKKAADLLVSSGIQSMEELLAIADRDDVERLTSIKQIGPKIARLLIDGLNDPAMRRRIAALCEAGLQCEEKEPPSKAEEQSFAGQVWCVTGSFEQFNPRTLALDEIERRGGRTTSSVTGKTTHLLAGSGAGSKLAQATKLGVEIVDEQRFLSMLKEEKTAQKSGQMQGEFSF
ncbi:NAD-dependent DNA ligase LigA [Sphaerochaeta sp. PS]|uniref:NAD-dependent DNA ligase LigA n=1 Tax=Sphaerochaeta sp. PS TaxID=3076336 RepID=UPI0028A37FFC|nr:NAD-dependent DNA ligase LigA [Sphaerochaeta sp. PS]MDT4762637.1 NAD-dependent DNA ligase LigA [Sphaerochaeta sp. PS]